ncbi:extracellular lipase [Colletotrichum higginsianum]|uniref:Lipase 1 n=1 Tax=Colletotrichum higginsianum TaxID=80884 RepID=A0A4T0VHY6_9PEZI|nr:Lipase 1 [Colletotrichum higginsianum]GJC97868.1 extracellular lipase [Colletotrichum higginsianum]
MATALSAPPRTKAPGPSNTTTPRLFAMIPVLLAALLVYFPSARQHLFGSHDAHPTVRIKQGIVVGKLLNDGKIPAPVEGFLGIPYALPPINDLRFRPAVPVPKGNGTLEAFYMGPRCPGKQMVPFLEDSLLGPDAESEDCLTINVFRPHGHDTSRAKLPVSVLVPGGAFNRGAARMHNTYTMLAHSPEPFVAVSMQYRIGVFGGLNTELTEKEGLLNLGLRDMYAALEWVQENIADFGGDPDDVTVMGLSAAAHGIGHFIMDAKQPKKLFHKAIMDSGAHTARTIHSPSSALNTQHFRDFLDLTPCGHYKDLGDPDILGCLRALSSETVDRAGKDVFARSEPSVRWAWQPVLDGHIISRRPLDAWKSGNWNKVPMLTGSTHNEGANYVPKTANASADFIDFFSTLLPHLTKSELAELEALYPDPATDPTSPYADQMLATLGAGAQYRRIEAAYGHYAYTCPVRQTAIWGSSNSPPDPPVFLYHWVLNRTALLGAVHGDQMRYQTYNSEVRGISAAQDEVSGKFHAYCVSFITKGDPSALKKGGFAAREEWTPWKDGRPSTMVLGEGNDERAGGTGKGTAAQMQDYTWGEQQCNFWWRVSERWED